MLMHSLELNWLEPKMLRTCSTCFLFVSFSLCSSPSPPALSHAQNTSVTPLLRSNGAPLLRSNGIPLLRSNVFFFLPFTPWLFPRSQYLGHSIAAKQWYSIAAKQCFFSRPPSFTLCLLPRSEYCTPLLRSNGIHWYSSPRCLEFPA